MKLPNADQCQIEEDKLRDYLLNPSHPVGRSKAQFFQRLGFRADTWQTLAAALRQHAISGEVISTRATEYGMLYVVGGPLQSAAPGNLEICTVWHLDHGAVAPRLVTAYPEN